MFKIKELETPTPSGIEECRLTIMKMLDDSVSNKQVVSKNIIHNEKETAESSNNQTSKTAEIVSNPHSENEERSNKSEKTNFSSYLQKNNFLPHTDLSQIEIIDDRTPIGDNDKLTKANEFIDYHQNGEVIFNENDLSNNTEKTNDLMKNGMFLNMNVNMNLLNPPPINIITNNNNVYNNYNGADEEDNQDYIPIRSYSMKNNAFDDNGKKGNSNYPNINQNFINSGFTQYNKDSFNNNTPFSNCIPNQLFNQNNTYNPMQNFYYNMYNNFQNCQQKLYDNDSYKGLSNGCVSQNYMPKHKNSFSYIEKGNNNYSKKKIKLQTNLNSMTLTEAIKNSNTLSKDQGGCRYLQKIISDNPEIAPQILNNAFEKIYEIVTDPFGNYLIQKLFDYMTSEQFCQFMALIQIDMYQICVNSFGTRVVQKLIDYLTSSNLILNFINLLKPSVKDIITDINGSHIILKLLDLHNSTYSRAIYQEINENIVKISTHKHGCCVLQKCIEKSSESDSESIINLLVLHCEALITDQCGNYIIQFIISLKKENINTQIADILVTNIEGFSKQKYSSNVVEKCFECCSDNICQKLLNSLHNEAIIISLLFDKFGNYVIQKGLVRASKGEQEYILTVIAPHLQKLKNYSFGLKLYSKLIISYSFLSKLLLITKEDSDEDM